MNYSNNENKGENQTYPVNLEMAQKFLSRLEGENKGKLTFQIFSEKKGGHSPPEIFSGTLDSHEDTLVKLNQSGSGIFITVNETDGKGRKLENITKIRALFVDLDGTPLDPILKSPLPPHMIINSSPGRYHAYWIVNDIGLNEFSFLQKQLIERFNSDPQVHDLSRVMRIPGFYHHKESPFLSTIVECNNAAPFERELFLDAFELELSRTDPPKNNLNPVLEALKRLQMILNKNCHPVGCWTIRCPWEHLHTQKDTGTKYFEPNTNGYPTHGFKCFHNSCKTKTTQDLLGYLSIPGVEKGEPLPLFREIEQARPYPIDALGDILGGAAKALQQGIKAPDAICAQSVLAAATLSVQGYANILIDGRSIPLSMFFITVAESGDRKSAADKFALKPIASYQKMLNENYRSELQKFKLKLEGWDVRKKAWQKENINSENIFSEPIPIEPTKPLILVEEPTYEGIVKYFSNNGYPNIAISSDEGTRFFGGHAMSEENLLKTLAGMSSIWDGREITRLRGGDGDTLLYNRRLSLHLMVQEMILKNLLSKPVFEEQGFLPRCLIAFPPSTSGNRSYEAVDLNVNTDIKKYWETLRQRMDFPLPANNELNLRNISLSRAAKERWIQFHDEIDKNISKGKKLHPIRRFANKAAEHVLRLSGVLTLIEDINAEEIPLNNLERGIKLIEYYLNEQARIQGVMSVNQMLERAQSLLKWLWGEGHTYIGLTTIYQYGPASIGVRNAKEARKMMGILKSHRWASPLQNKLINGKNHTEAWEITPPQEDVKED